MERAQIFMFTPFFHLIRSQTREQVSNPHHLLSLRLSQWGTGDGASFPPLAPPSGFDPNTGIQLLLSRVHQAPHLQRGDSGATTVCFKVSKKDK